MEDDRPDDNFLRKYYTRLTPENGKEDEDGETETNREQKPGANDSVVEGNKAEEVDLPPSRSGSTPEPSSFQGPINISDTAIKTEEDYDQDRQTWSLKQRDFIDIHNWGSEYVNGYSMNTPAASVAGARYMKTMVMAEVSGGCVPCMVRHTYSTLDDVPEDEQFQKVLNYVADPP